MIFANASILKYNLGSVTVIDYGLVTRTLYNGTLDKLSLYSVLGFAPWKTDYGS
jgi:hypothetical protein